MKMSTEYFNSSDSLCSNSFENFKRRRVLSGDLKLNYIDNESLMEYTAENSTKASSSSIQESITNMSNSHSTPEDNFSENALLSPFSKAQKQDLEKLYDTSLDHYSLTQNPNGIFKSSSSSNNYASIDETINSVLSKIREENDTVILKSLNPHSLSSNTSVSASVKIDLNNSMIAAVVSTSSDSDLMQYSKGSFHQFSHSNSNTQSARIDSAAVFNSNFSDSKFSKTQSHHFFNYGNYFNIPCSFPNQISMPNYSRAAFGKDVDKNNVLYNHFQYPNQSYRPYLTNPFINQSYYRPDTQNIPVQSNYHIFQKPIKRDAGFDHLILDNDMAPQSAYGINFKTPQTTACNFFDQTIRKKRQIVDQNKLTPSKKRKLINQQPFSNNYGDLINKLKATNHNSLLMNPLLSQNRLLLPPLEFAESKLYTENFQKQLKYHKYKSSTYCIVKPKRFKNSTEKDDFLSHYFTETLSEKVLLSDNRNFVSDNMSDIICMSPIDNCHQSNNLLANLQEVEVSRNTDSPQLVISQNLPSYANNRSTGCEPQFCDYYNYHPQQSMTSVVAYGDNEAKLITHSKPIQERDLRTYIQLSGSFLKRTKINGKAFSSVHIEEAVSVASLGASKNQNSCRHCLMFLTGVACIKKNGRKLGSDSNEDYLFCSSCCYSSFKLNVQSCSTNTISHHNNAQSSQILIKTTSYKPPKNYKKVCDFEQYVRRRFPSEGQSETVIKSETLSETTCKRLLGINYSHYNVNKPKPLCIEIEKENQNELLSKYSCIYRAHSLTDIRVCVLCQGFGDDIENVCGRLMNVDASTWVHLNCGLWCFEVFETVSGSLMGVQSALLKAIKTQCSYCNKDGAGLQCYRNKCISVYHVPCAYKIGCIFYTDRGMYCPQHAVLNHPMHLPALTVERRVNVFRDECALVADVVLEDQEMKCKIRIGTLILNSIGQLLPEQLISGQFNSSSIIYPIGYHSTRIYWSSLRVNRRCKYECYIHEEENMPLFKIVFMDNDDREICLSDRSCDKLWKSILNKIATLRQEAGLTRLFPLYLSGEQLYGLTEPHIVRVIESLPGVEMIKKYAFKFGKMQLITEMPLAINPSGCARTEMKLRTYVRRSLEDTISKQNPCGILKAKQNQQLFIYDTPNANKVVVSNSRAQQYKFLKTEWVNNVILSRSKIQGLGLFAAKEFEKSTMIIEYIGETIRNEVGNRREQLYQSRNNSIYMFRLNDDLIIDATVNGGLARYINHSCNPNCVAEFLSLDCGSRIIISTKQRIEKGDELTYDYKFDFEDNKSDKIPCLCGAPNCRRWMN